MSLNPRREAVQSMLEEVLADPASALKEINAVLTLAERFSLEDVERLAKNRLLTQWGSGPDVDVAAIKRRLDHRKNP
jgi:hypothetical protein